MAEISGVDDCTEKLSKRIFNDRALSRLLKDDWPDTL
jgi:hypothetical protein